ncbi:MAG: hypothetical protein P1Q69_00715 [Candidatus Thorarchaeota archaeon]|nr:hypothetical protein [Candidatus Thorarchaeota archaeon]
MGIFEQVVELASSTNRNSRIDSLAALAQSCVKHPPPKLTSSERESLLQKAREFFEEPDYLSSESIVYIVAQASEPEDIHHIENHEVFRYEGEPEGFARFVYQNDFHSHILGHWGVFQKGEVVLLRDTCTVLYGNGNLRRRGYIFVTDRRVIFLGEVRGLYSEHSDSTRFLYDDWEQLPYLQNYDFINLDQIVNIESKWGWTSRTLSIDCKVKHVVEKSRTIFGPYFFKWDLPKTHDVREGLVNIKVDLDRFQFVNFPKDWRKIRQERIVEVVRDRMSALH